jgi:hypothetical protein
VNRPRNSYVFSLSPLLAAYATMSQRLHGLTSECYLDRVTPALTTLFTRIEHVFKLFCNQANDVLRSKTSDRARLLKTAGFLVSEWVDFVAAFAAAAEQRISPHLAYVSLLFTSLLGQLDQLQDLVDVGTFETLLPQCSFAQIRVEAAAMQREIRADAEPFDDAAFSGRIGRLVLSVSAIFRHSVPKCSMATGAVMRLRTGINLVCAELAYVGHAICAFPELVQLARIAIADAGSELDKALEILRMPVEIRTLHDRRDPALQAGLRRRPVQAKR